MKQILKILTTFILSSVTLFSANSGVDKAKMAAKTSTVKAKKKTSKPINIKQSVALEDMSKPLYYKQCSTTPLQVGDEEYQKSYLALRGLKGVYVNIDDVLKGANKKNVTMLKDLKREVIRRLNSAGIRLLTEEEMEKTPGQPQMSMFPSFPKHLSKPKPGQPKIVYREDCCTMGIWTSFLQGARILRDPVTNYKLGTWGEGHNTHDCSDIGGWMSKVVLDTIDSFVEDKKRADSDYTKMLKEGKIKLAKIKEAKVATPAETGNMTCNTSLMMYIEIFKTNSTFILPSKHYILDKLADAMKSCPQYGYLIETHADQRASAEHNRKLTEARAKSIRFYLLSKGVPQGQFDIQSFGESRPVSKGSSTEDHAANRRVVVTPFKIQ